MLPFSWDFSRVLASLSSPVFLTFFVLSIVGIVYVRRVWRTKSGFTATDKMATLWFWVSVGLTIRSIRQLKRGPAR